MSIPRRSRKSSTQYRVHEVQIEIDGRLHTFIKGVDGEIVGHSRECCASWRQPAPCGCYRTHKCEQAQKLARAVEDARAHFRNLPRAILDPDDIAAEAEKVHVAQIEEYRHKCICKAFDRPRRRPANLTASGIQTDAAHAVIRSHPDHPGALNERWEDRWLNLNPAWPGMSLKSQLGQLKPPCVWVQEDDAEAEIIEREGYSARVVYVKQYEPPVRQEPQPVAST